MILFPVMILIAWIIIIVLNILISMPIYNFSVWYIILAVVGSTVAVIAIDGITSGIVRLLPQKWFNPLSKRFKVFQWEKPFYEAIGIKKWKDLVPELGQFTNFRKNKIADPYSPEYVYRYLLELVYGEVGHIASYFTGFLIIFIFPLQYALCFGVPVAIVNLIMIAMPVMILRYNYPKLVALYRLNLKKSQKEKQKIDET